MAETINQQVIHLSKKLIARNWKIITAESCTGGGLAYTLTEISGSSAWFERGLVTYSNQAKEELLGVKAVTLENFGAVSAQTAEEMAAGALSHSPAQISVAITGIAGPDGGTADKPVGTIWISCAARQQPIACFHHLLKGNREQVRKQTIELALLHLIEFTESQ